MSRFSQPRIGAPDGFFVVTFPMSPSTLFDWHVHEEHQLAWAANGVLTVLTEGTTWVLPPSRAFVTAFRRETGTTPAAYFGRTRATPA